MPAPAARLQGTIRPSLTHHKQPQARSSRPRIRRAWDHPLAAASVVSEKCWSRTNASRLSGCCLHVISIGSVGQSQLQHHVRQSQAVLDVRHQRWHLHQAFNILRQCEALHRSRYVYWPLSSCIPLLGHATARNLVCSRDQGLPGAKALAVRVKNRFEAVQPSKSSRVFLFLHFLAAGTAGLLKAVAQRAAASVASAEAAPCAPYSTARSSIMQGSHWHLVG